MPSPAGLAGNGLLGLSIFTVILSVWLHLNFLLLALYRQKTGKL